MFCRNIVTLIPSAIIEFVHHEKGKRRTVERQVIPRCPARNGQYTNSTTPASSQVNHDIGGEAQLQMDVQWQHPIASTGENELLFVCS